MPFNKPNPNKPAAPDPANSACPVAESTSNEPPRKDGWITGNAAVDTALTIAMFA